MPIDKLVKIVKDSMDETTTHDYPHTLRVYKLAERFAVEENADVELVKIGALLHDIGRPIGEPHTETGTVKAREVLESFQYPVDRISLVLDIVRNHGSSGRSRIRTVEEQVVWDADKVDGFGAIGLARAFHMRGENHMVFHDFSWFREITERQFNLIGTPSARRYAAPKFKYMEEFFRQLDDESNYEKFIKPII